jgi:glycosyltransferase involved in cell wall biosynthesis
MNKRILYYTGSLASGGAERQLLYTAIAAKNHGYKVKIVIDYPTCHYEEMIRQNEIEVHCTHSTRFSPVKRWTAFSRIISGFRPDIFHSFLATKNLWGMALAKVHSVPVRIASVRNTNKDEFTGIRLYKRWADKIICNTRMAKEIALKDYGVLEEKLAVIYNAIDLDRFRQAKTLYGLKASLGLEEGTLLGVTVARFAEQKNHLGLIRALKILHDEGLLEKIHYLLVGNPGDRVLFDQASAEVRNCGLSQKVTFLGVRQDIPEILKTCNFMVLPSFYEGFPNVVLEAMASGVFVIATPTGGTPELIEDGVNGLLAEGCKPEELVRGLWSYLQMDESQKEAIRLAGADRVTCFDQERTFEKICTFYEGSNKP